jgi:hypothetical protein
MEPENRPPTWEIGFSCIWTYSHTWVANTAHFITFTEICSLGTTWLEKSLFIHSAAWKTCMQIT